MKKKYYVANVAEEVCEGVIELTDEEYEIVKRVTDPCSWENRSGGGYCGYFKIEPLSEYDPCAECDWDNPSRLCADCSFDSK